MPLQNKSDHNPGAKKAAFGHHTSALRPLHLNKKETKLVRRSTTKQEGGTRSDALSLDLLLLHQMSLLALAQRNEESLNSIIPQEPRKDLYLVARPRVAQTQN
ncbi:unnamed protein product [Eruca vesicaria subsp. sativa]|uniref:Uncharacterized protein n=1 Tax=Eruca vesicaria subsp. sativa TaxID=29727 RepID=A0ABC8M7T4_ERUVS|nr:unnamed protein product [Eruca vesicaria subsp. sativa]